MKRLIYIVLIFTALFAMTACGKSQGEQNTDRKTEMIILRWNLQKGVVVIPGSSNPEHIQENTELFDFELTEKEMAQINALDRNEKHDWY